MNHKKNRGFTLLEVLIVVAIIGVLVAIMIPLFANHMEKSREATDMANVRAAYAELMVKVMESENTPETISVPLKQKVSGWQTPTPITIGGICYEGNGTANWTGTPQPNGTCTVSYQAGTGVIFNWNGTNGGNATQTPVSGNLMATKTFLKGQFNKRNNNSMQTNTAYFSDQTFEVDGREVKVRVYYAGSKAFQKTLEGYEPKPTTYDKSPFYNVQHPYNVTEKKDGFAYYTYDDKGNIKEFIYVNDKNVYKTTDEGETWYDITPNATSAG